jgi:hypothetical protein
MIVPDVANKPQDENKTEDKTRIKVKGIKKYFPFRLFRLDIFNITISLKKKLNIYQLQLTKPPLYHCSG